ncbi:acyltransferase [Beduini massiliensis]|uniref:acyltransferase n=1 Tax=Beduini massiliensis TaxID=1585974 RepID=UPI00069345E1|nr:acyltransferase family protein [Beduini massiliensis]
MGNVVETIPRQRNTSLDIARVVAIMAVVMIHVSAAFVMSNELGSLEFIWGNIFDSISRIGVPLFVMISGALMLDEERPFSIKDLFSKRLPQIIFLLIVWSAIYAVGYKLVIPLVKGESISIKSFIAGFASGHYHLWYLYMQIGLYLALPFLRAIVCKKNKNLVLLYLAISLLTQFTIPVIQALSLQFGFVAHLITLIRKLQLGFFNVFVSYFLAGWYIVHVGVSKKIKIALYVSSILALLMMIVYVNFTKDYANAYADGILVFVYSVGVFLALNSVKYKQGFDDIVSIPSKSSFGIYVVHAVLLDVIKHLLPKTLVAPLYMLVCWMITFVISLFATFALSKIPYFKKLVRM